MLTQLPDLRLTIIINKFTKTKDQQPVCVFFSMICYFRDRLKVVEAMLNKENSATSTRTRQLLAQKEKELEMTKTRSTSTRTREKLAEVEVALKMEMEKKTSTRTR